MRTETRPRLSCVEPVSPFRLRLTYSDGASGVVDLSHLADRGVFRLWNDPASFCSVQIGPGGELHWSDDVELCGDALYMQVTGKRPEEVFDELGQGAVHA